MTRADRWEARVALAMLPVGGAVLIGSVVGLVAVLALALDGVIGGDGTWLLLLWCGVSAAFALWNMRAGIAMMSAFDWRPLPLSLLRSAGVVAGWLVLP